MGVPTGGHQASSRSADCPFVHEGMPQKAAAGQNTRTGSGSIMSQSKAQTENEPSVLRLKPDKSHTNRRRFLLVWSGLMCIFLLMYTIVWLNN